MVALTPALVPLVMLRSGRDAAMTRRLGRFLSTLPEEEAHHAVHVLRLSVGDRIGLLNGRGSRAEAELVATAGEEVQRRGLLGVDHRVSVVDAVDERPDAQPRRHRRHRRESKEQPHRRHPLRQPAQLSVPTNEHYLPLLYALGVKDDSEPIVYFNDAATMGSISMRSLRIG